MNEVTRIFARIENGEATATDELFTFVYEELKRLARRRLRHERPDHSLQASALVHETYLRLVNVKDASQWDNRGHFFAAASEAMRRILIDSARRKLSEKHGGAHNRMITACDKITHPGRPEELLELDETLRDFESIYPEKAQLVKLRYFGGMTLEEAAKTLGISRATAARQWAFAKAWLFERLGK